MLLPETLAAAPAALRRAVVTHELFHVRRGDWLSVLGEEALRTLLWFHPAILWLTSHIQLAREEMVDELTVRATGDRRAYMQALLAFADTGGIHPAPAFAHRRQLFHRILSVSKEKAMSVPRIVASGVIVVAALAGASWYASTLFPIVVAAAVETPAAVSVSSVQELAQPAEQIPATIRVAAARCVAVVQRTAGGNVQDAPREVTPENPIPRRTRNVQPAWPAQFAGRQFHVLVHSLVTIDRNGVVIAVERGGCQVVERPAVGEQNDAVCRAFSDVSATGIRQWRYDRPVQAPLRFTVLSTFVPGSEPTVTQAGSDLQRYLRETPESLRGLAEPTRGITVANQNDVDNQLRVWRHGRPSCDRRVGRGFNDQLRELERAQRLADERFSETHPVLRRLRIPGTMSWRAWNGELRASRANQSPCIGLAQWPRAATGRGGRGERPRSCSRAQSPSHICRGNGGAGRRNRRRRGARRRARARR